MKQQLENWSFIEVWEMLKIYNGPVHTFKSLGRKETK